MAKRVPSAVVIDALQHIVPGAESATPDAVHFAMNHLGRKLEWTRITGGSNVDPFDSRSAREILDLVLGTSVPLEGELIVVTDDTYPDGLMLPVDQLRPVMESTQSWIGLDVMIISLSQRTLAMIHHEGAFAHVAAQPP